MTRIKNYLLIFAVLSLTACVSPAAQMTPEQLSTLSNQQLCNLKNNYLWDQNTEIEVGRRNLNCDPIYNECLLRGAEPNGAEMALCMNQIREQQAMQRTINQQQAELDLQRRRNDMIVQSQQVQARNQVVIVQPQKNPSPFCPTFPYCN